MVGCGRPGTLWLLHFDAARVGLLAPAVRWMTWAWRAAFQPSGDAAVICQISVGKLGWARIGYDRARQHCTSGWSASPHTGCGRLISDPDDC
jgi:hypothetical protein